MKYILILIHLEGIQDPTSSSEQQKGSKDKNSCIPEIPQGTNLQDARFTLRLLFPCTLVVVVAQCIVRWLPKPEIRGLNLVIGR